jgi:putative FmdB family regulatory protein
MPTYEYECEKCGYRFEEFQSMNDRPVRICPTCGGPVRRLLGTGAAVIVRGAGLHSTEGGPFRARCGQERPCCGRDTPCDTPPCED